MKVTAAARSHIGYVRSNNEDNFFLNGFYLPLENMNEGGLFNSNSKNNVQIYAVCDGMGGGEHGELASYYAVSSMLELYTESSVNSIRDNIINYVDTVNEKILKESEKYGKRAGSTMVLFCIIGNKSVIAHLGDSRMYILRSNRLSCLTEDHTKAQEMRNLGDSENCHLYTNVLTRHLGFKREGTVLEPTFNTGIALKKGDVFLLCSDGLSGFVSEEDICIILNKNISCSAKCKALVDCALISGGKDNVTVIVLKIESGGLFL